MKFYRSDPTENDSVEGLRPNARGPGLVTFGVSVQCAQPSVIDSSHSFCVLLGAFASLLY